MTDPGPPRPLDPPDRSDWPRRLAVYAEPDARRSAFQLAGNLSALFVCWATITASLGGPRIATALLSGLAGMVLMRLFIVLHDCGHRTYFASERANDWVGRGLGLITFTPFGYWQRSHAVHHATAGDLGRRGIGDIDTLTVREFRGLPPRRRLWYRILRNPWVLFGIGPLYQFLLRQRVPLHLPAPTAAMKRSIWTTNAVLLAALVAVGLALGLEGLFWIAVAPVLVMATVAVWMFFVQHQFERTHWYVSEDWSFAEAGLAGSSFYDLPRPLHFLTGHIGIHHVHHLCPRIPNYRLAEVLDQHPELRGVSRLSLRQSLGCPGLALWDEDAGRLVSFRDAASLSPLESRP